MITYIIDDEPKIRRGLGKAIASYKPDWPEAKTAASAEEALMDPDFFRSDILFLDVKLPNMSGLDLLKILHNNEVKIHTIVISGFAEFSFAQTALSLNAVDYLLKPINLNSLRNVIDKTENLILTEASNRIIDISALEANRIAFLREMLELPEEYTQQNFSSLLLQIGMKDTCFFLLCIQSESDNSQKSWDCVISLIKEHMNSAICRMDIEYAEENRIVSVFMSDIDNLSTFRKTLEEIDFCYDFEMSISSIYSSLCKLSVAQDEAKVSKPIRCNADKTQYIRSLIDKMIKLHSPASEAVIYIESNYKYQISLSSISEKIHIHPSYLSNVFKKEAGVGLWSFVNDYRLYKAKELLISSDEKISIISEKVGFTDYHYFSQVFTKRIGITPQKYRSLYKK